jgi:type I restriction enzyme S subunit
VPSHWFRSALKRIAEYQNGYAFKPEDWVAQGTPIIRIAQLTSIAEPNYYDGELDEKLRVENGDLLFSWSATIDSFIWNSGSAWLNQHIFKVSPTNEAITPYLYYLIKFVAPKLADLDAHGSTMRHIKKESLGQLVYVPVIEEQTAIATFLDHETAKIDGLIAEQEKLIALLAEKRQATISYAVTKGLNPAAPMKDSGVAWLGEVPAHWLLGQLKNFIHQNQAP